MGGAAARSAMVVAGSILLVGAPAVAQNTEGEGAPIYCNAWTATGSPGTTYVSRLWMGDWEQFPAFKQTAINELAAAVRSSQGIRIYEGECWRQSGSSWGTAEQNRRDRMEQWRASGYQVVEVDWIFSGGRPGPALVARQPASSPVKSRPPASAQVTPAPAVSGPAPAEPSQAQEPNDSIKKRNDALADARQRARVDYEAGLNAYEARVQEAEAARRAHEQEVARARAARELYERERAAHEALVNRMGGKRDKEQLVQWKEAVAVCTFDPADGQARLGNWRCQGPLQFTYAKIGGPAAPLSARSLANVAQACGGSAASLRDLGAVGGHRVFGCNFGLHPNPRGRMAVDAAQRAGLDYIPGRISFRCPSSQSGCRAR